MTAPPQELDATPTQDFAAERENALVKRLRGRVVIQDTNLELLRFSVAQLRAQLAEKQAEIERRDDIISAHPASAHRLMELQQERDALVRQLAEQATLLNPNAGHPPVPASQHPPNAEGQPSMAVAAGDQAAVREAHPQPHATTAAPNAPVPSAEEVEEQVNTLRSFGQAYPLTMFRDLTDFEHEQHPKLISRASAQMGRHCAKFMADAATLIERLAARLADSDARLRLARNALERYFKPSEIGDDVAPRIIEMHSALKAQLAEAQKDAARYRWLRSDSGDSAMRSPIGLLLGHGANLDLAIEAAMRERKT